MQSCTSQREVNYFASQAKEECQYLREKCASYESQLKRHTEEGTKAQQRLDNLQRMNQLLMKSKDRVYEENERLQNSTCKLKLENQFLKQETQVLKQEKEGLLQDNSSLRKERDSLHEQLLSLQNENRQLCLAQQEYAAFGIQPWKVSREKVKQGEVIGGGGWGAVMKGDLHVAIKQFYPTILSPPNVARLKREMELLARVRHPNLVQFIGVVFEEHDNYDENPPYIITELLDITLRRAYQQNQIPEGNMCPIFEDVARALDYLHRRHEPVLHRDVSSANVLLKCLPNGHWMAKVSDLGSANLASEAFTKNEGAVIYCAPEAFTAGNDTQSKEKLTTKVDVYSYGILLCEVATSTLPDKDLFPSMLDQVQYEWPKLHHLITVCIRQEPKQRPSMEKVLAAVQGL